MKINKNTLKEIIKECISEMELTEEVPIYKTFDEVAKEIQDDIDSFQKEMDEKIKKLRDLVKQNKANFEA